jgi:DNA-directed RNA polymerase subunit RPC12/RpoP
MANCKLCHARRLETDPELAQTLCSPCATKLGTTPMPPPRRPDVPCPRCRGRRFIRVFPRERFVVDASTKWLGSDLSAFGAMYAPMAATYEVSIVRQQIGVMIGAPEVRGLDLSQPRGLIARYICSTCGFVELFCENPESIPIGTEYMSDIVDYGGDKPYR